MKPEEKADLATAAPKLKILDVILARSSFSRPMQDAPENAKAWQQHKRGVQYATEGSVAGGDQELHVLVQLGTRVLMSMARPRTMRNTPGLEANTTATKMLSSFGSIDTMPSGSRSNTRPK